MVERCDPLSPYGDVKSPKLDGNFEQGKPQNYITKCIAPEVSMSGTMSPVKREAIDAQITNHISLLRTQGAGVRRH